MKRLIAICVLLAAACALPATAQKTPPVVSIETGRAASASKAPRSDNSLLPKIFAGWEMSGSPEVSKDPATADPTNAAVLKEYGLTDYESAAYVRPGGRKLTVKAIRFKDATGGYGAFTFYKAPEMLNEKIGDQGASLNERVLFYRANVLVQAVLDKVTVMSAAELRELANDLLIAQGPAANLPTLPAYLPKQSYIPNTAKFILGPAALQTMQAPLTADLIDFSRSPDVVLGKYETGAGIADLMIVGYPTPQIAAERLRAVEGAHPPTDSSAAVQFMTKRSGPMLVVVAGKISPSEGKSLLASVNYDAEVTWNQQTHLSKRDNIGNLIINDFLLIAIIFAFAIVIGIAFGGVRILIKRFFPERVFDRDLDIIQLNLK